MSTHNKLMKSWSEKIDKGMYLTHIDRKFVVPERFVRTFKNKTYKHMTAVSKKCMLIN